MGASGPGAGWSGAVGRLRRPSGRRCWRLGTLAAGGGSSSSSSSSSCARASATGGAGEGGGTMTGGAGSGGAGSTIGGGAGGGAVKGVGTGGGAASGREALSTVVAVGAAAGSSSSSVRTRTGSPARGVGLDARWGSWRGMAATATTTNSTEPPLMAKNGVHRQVSTRRIAAWTSSAMGASLGGRRQGASHAFAPVTSSAPVATAAECAGSDSESPPPVSRRCRLTRAPRSRPRRRRTRDAES